MDSDNVYLLNAGIKKPQSMEIKSIESYEASIRINALQINKITFSKKHQGLKGALIGLGTGAAICAIAGYAPDDDPPGWFSFTAGEKVEVLAVFGGLTGALVGALIGALVKQTFIIGGKKDAYRDVHSELAQRLNVQ